MNYRADENDVKNTVLDFIKFCDFMEAERPLATQKGDLSTKACYSVNQLLRYAAKNTKQTDRIYQYATVSLWFHIAKEAGLIACFDGNGGKTFFNTTAAYLDFKKMNVFSQYWLIFNTWFCFVDVEAQYRERGSGFTLSNLMERVFDQLCKQDFTQWMQRKKCDYQMYSTEPVQLLMEHYHKTAHILMALGLLVLEEGDTLSKDYHCPVIDKIKPTHFGTCMMKVCEDRKYEQYNVFVKNRHSMDMFDLTDDSDDDIEVIETETDAFITPFLSCFPPDTIDTAAINAMLYACADVEKDNRIFEFEVSLGKKCYRVIRCLPTHTFESLHLAIQEAFEFDNDHLYSFYLDGKPHSHYAVNARYTEMPPYTHEVCLKDVRLLNKQHILYLFDFGDCWEFDITVTINTGEEANFETPQIIKTVGEAPEQYAPYSY